jgi:hypothetical protein
VKIVFEDHENRKEYLNVPDDIYNAVEALMECYCKSREGIKVNKYETGDSDKA